MLSDPKNILFENSTDLVDYVTLGLPPAKRKYIEFRNAIQNPVSSEDDLSQYARKQVAVRGNLVEHLTQEELYEILDRVYTNQRKNYTVGLGIGIGVAIVAGCVGFFFGCSKTDEKWESKLDDYTMHF